MDSLLFSVLVRLLLHREKVKIVCFLYFTIGLLSVYYLNHSVFLVVLHHGVESKKLFHIRFVLVVITIASCVDIF